MGIQIFRPPIEEAERIIVISDIHGDYNVLVELLEQLHYSKEDVLLVLGDIIERGPQNLATLRLLMQMEEEFPVFALLGNNDMIVREIERPDRNDKLLQYMLSRKKSILWEMCREMSIDVDEKTDITALKILLREHFAPEIEFIRQLPHVIETEHYLFAHAQALPGKPEDWNPSDVLRGDYFMNKGYVFDKYVIVGHYPAVLYRDNCRDANPLVREQQKIITIDGGLQLKPDGQLNALIIHKNRENPFEFTYADGKPKARALNSQLAGDFCHMLVWPDNQVKILREENDFAYCRHKKTEEHYWIPKSFLWEQEDGWHTNDYLDYQIRVTMGDIVSVLLKTSRGYLIKKDGVTGWYYGMLEML